MFKSIAAWFKSFFTSNAVKAATVAGLFMASNNKEKAQSILPYIKAVRASAQCGTLTQDQVNSMIDLVLKKFPNPKAEVLINLIDFPVVTYGEVNKDLLKIIDALIKGAETGAA